MCISVVSAVVRSLSGAVWGKSTLRRPKKKGRKTENTFSRCRNDGRKEEECTFKNWNGARHFALLCFLNNNKNKNTCATLAHSVHSRCLPIHLQCNPFFAVFIYILLHITLNYYCSCSLLHIIYIHIHRYI